MAKMTIELDEDDYRDFQKEIAYRQAQRRVLPDHESSLAGAMIGEIVRDLWEYRDLYDGDNPHEEPPRWEGTE